MKKILFVTLLVVGLIQSACYYDNEEELYGTTECKTDNITYSNDVLPIIQNNCYRCHDTANNQGNVTLEGYSNLKLYVDNGKLLGAIRRDPGFSPMPQDGPQLVGCLIEKIEVWVQNGALNN